MDLEVQRADAAGKRPRVIITYKSGAEGRLQSYLQGEDVARLGRRRAVAFNLRNKRARDLAAHPDVVNVIVWGDNVVWGDTVVSGDAGVP